MEGAGEETLGGWRGEGLEVNRMRLLSLVVEKRERNEWREDI